MAYFDLYVQAKPKGYFGQEDVPVLEKLCVANALYDKAMDEMLERNIMKIDDILGDETADPHIKVMMSLGEAVARFTKLLGLTPQDRGRPVADKYGKPIIHGQAQPTQEEANHATVQNKYWGRRVIENDGSK